MFYKINVLKNSPNSQENTLHKKCEYINKNVNDWQKIVKETVKKKFHV